MPTAEEVRAKTVERQKKMFEAWMAMPTNRFMLSLIPPGKDESTKEAMDTLLRSAFEFGFAAGSSNMALDVLAMTMTVDPSRPSKDWKW